MTGERVMPGLGLKAFFTPGSNAWDTEFDKNLRILSAVAQLNVLSRVAAVPGSPANGDIYLLTAAPNQYSIAVRDAGAWVYLVPQEGWLAWVADEDKRYTFNGTTWVSFYTNAEIDAAIAAVSVTQKVFQIQDQKTLSTDGGTSTAGAWYARDLNTVILNEITGASLASNQFTLPAGTFEIDAKSGFFGVNGCQIRLQNITDATLVETGVCSNTSGAASVQTSDLRGKFTIAAPKVFEVQYRVTTGRATNGLGVNTGFAAPEVYTQVLIRKVG